MLFLLVTLFSTNMFLTQIFVFIIIVKIVLTGIVRCSFNNNFLVVFFDKFFIFIFIYETQENLNKHCALLVKISLNYEI